MTFLNKKHSWNILTTASLFVVFIFTFTFTAYAKTNTMPYSPVTNPDGYIDICNPITDGYTQHNYLAGQVVGSPKPLYFTSSIIPPFDYDFGGDNAGSFDGMNWDKQAIWDNECVEPTTSITVYKETTDDSGDNVTFFFNSDFGSFQLLGDGVDSHTTVDPMSNNRIDEIDIPEGWTLDSVACTGNDTPTTEYFNEDDVLTGIYVAPLAGEQITCTFTNTKIPERASITIMKETADPSGHDMIFDFQSGFGAFSVKGDNTDSYTYNPTSFDGSFHIDEIINHDGWVLSSVECLGEGETTLKYEENSTKLTGVYVTPVENQNTTCTFTNSLALHGCMDNSAINFDELATISDDSCLYSNPTGDDDDDSTETEHPWCSFEGTVIDVTPDAEALTNEDAQVPDERRHVEAVGTIAPYANFGGKEGNDWQVDPLDFFSLGIGGFVTYEFTNTVAFNQDGADIAIYEITGGNTAEQTEESILVEVSQNGSDWVSLGSHIGDAEIDISSTGLEYVKFVRLTDESQEVQGANGDGYDLDGIVILQGSCGDEPIQEGGGALRGGGGGGTLLNPTKNDDVDENEDDDTPEGQTQGDSDTRSDDTSSTKDTDKPEGEVQGDQVSVVPVGAPNAGGGGMSPNSSTSSVPVFALFGMILGAIMLRIKPING